MANKIILADTSIFIDHFRKSDKSNSKLIGLYDHGYRFCISSITEYEIYYGAADKQIEYWREFLSDINIISFDSNAAQAAVKISKLLKLKSKQIDNADLFIAATAISNNLPIATFFERIDNLTLID